jgi:hypothetical protein
MGEAVRDEDEGPGRRSAHLVSELEAYVTRQDVHGLILTSMHMQRWTFARRVSGFQSGQCTVRLLTADDEGYVAAEWAAKLLAFSRANSQPMWFAWHGSNYYTMGVARAATASSKKSASPTSASIR